MKLDLIESYILSAGFNRTRQPINKPIVVHGVPGSGKSSLIRSLIEFPTVRALTLGAPYGETLTTPGVERYTPDREINASILILDEYQLWRSSDTPSFDLLFGDPFQGPYRLAPHFANHTSLRVPRPIALFLTQRGFQIHSVKPGSIKRQPVYTTSGNPTGPVGQVIHLGPVSKQLTHSHGVCSKTPEEVQGLEFHTVTLVYHSSEVSNRQGFYVAATRATDRLIIVTDEPIDELLATC